METPTRRLKFSSTKMSAVKLQNFGFLPASSVKIISARNSLTKMFVPKVLLLVFFEYPITSLKKGGSSRAVNRRDVVMINP